MSSKPTVEVNHITQRILTEKQIEFGYYLEHDRYLLGYYLFLNTEWRPLAFYQVQATDDKIREAVDILMIRKMGI